MPADRSLPPWAQRLIELRRARTWSPADLACELKKRRDDLPSVRSLAHMIQLDWETGKHRPGPRYRLLLAAVFDTDEQQIFDVQAARKAPLQTAHRPNGAVDNKPYSPGMAKPIDGFNAEGNIRAAADEVPPVAQETPPRITGTDGEALRRTSNAVEALQITMTGDPAGPDLGLDGLAELVLYYAHAVAVAPSTAIYAELLSARSFAGTLLGRTSPRQRGDLMVTAGWLSSLLAISAADLGDHAAAVVWCADTERRGRNAGYPELLGWAALTRALIAWYQGDPLRSAAIAQRGQADGLPGSVAHAKLAAHEMRCLAMLGDNDGMAAARRLAAAAMAQLAPSVPATGVYSIPRVDDPPYTATSLLLASKYAEAAQMTRRLIDTAYRPQSRAPGDQPTTYARTLLILALAAAGLGELDEAVAAGAAALECGPVVWSTMMLAHKLDRSLARQFPGAARVADLHDRCIEASTRLAIPTTRPVRGSA
jgi:transcriptional regulator with XRE-family HTH domain